MAEFILYLTVFFIYSGNRHDSNITIKVFLGLHKQLKFNLELVKLDVLKIIGYCDNIIIKCLKSFLRNKQRIQEEMLTLLKTETFFLSFLTSDHYH